MYWFVLIATLVGLGAGYALGLQRSRGAVPFADAESARELGEKGHAEVQARIERRKERIVARARKLGSITNDDVEDLFCISDTTARRYLNELEKEGKVRQEGAGRGTRYVPAVS